MTDNLTPKLNRQQLIQNIDALSQQNAPHDFIQGYIDKYTQDANGNFILKDQTPSEPQPNLGQRIAQTQAAGGERIVKGVTRGSQLIQEGQNNVGANSGIITPKGVLKTLEGGATAASDAVLGATQTALAPITEVAKTVIKKETPLITGFLRTMFPNAAKAYDALAPEVQTKVQPLLEQAKQFTDKHPDETHLAGNFLELALLGVGGGEAKALEPALTEAGGQSLKDIATSIPADLKQTATDLKPVINKTINTAKDIKSQIDIQKAAMRYNPKKSFNTALEISRPTEEIVQKTAIPENRMISPTLTKKAQYTPSPYETRIAEAVQPLVDNGELTSKMRLSEQRNVITTKVNQINQGVKDLVRKPEYNIPFTNSQLEEKLGAIKSKNRILFGSDKTAQKDYDIVINEFKKFVKTNNTEGILNARQSFDAYVRKSFPQAFKKDLNGAVNPKYQALMDARTAANQMAADLLDQAQVSQIKGFANPTQAKEIIGRAQNFPKKEDFVSYMKENVAKEYPDSGFASQITRNRQAIATENLGAPSTSYATSVEQDLGEIWDIAHSTISPTAGKVFIQGLRNESELLQASENIGTKMKASDTRSGFKKIISSKPVKIVAGAALAGTVGSKAYHAVAGQ